MPHTIGLILLGVLAALVIRTFVAEPVRVKGASMSHTLHSGEVLLVTRFDYRIREPERHEVVICHYPGRFLDRGRLIPQQFVKRIVGLPGETVEIAEGVVLIDGEPLEEDFLDETLCRRRADMQPRTLGPDEYFVMGDNRDHSNDSRRVGAIGRGMITGRVRRVIWPPAAWRSVR